MSKFSFAHTRAKASVQRQQPALDLALAPVTVLAEGIIGTLARVRLLARWLAVHALNARDDRMLDAIGRDRARILRVVAARERVEAAWFPGDPL